MKLNDAIQVVRAEYLEAERKFGPFKNAHEGYAVLLEEVDELWAEVKTQCGPNRDARMLAEAVQVAAMAIRFLVDFGKSDGAP